jgi:hypothetical protein
MENFLIIKDIINSIRFYLMLSIVCKQDEYFMENPEQKFNEYLDFLKNHLYYTQDKINHYIKIATDTIPADFCNYYGIEKINRR